MGDFQKSGNQSSVVERRCKNCIHWDRDENKNSGLGTCTKLPPEPAMSTHPDELGVVVTMWRETAENERCGAFATEIRSRHHKPQRQSRRMNPRRNARGVRRDVVPVRRQARNNAGPSYGEPREGRYDGYGD